MDAVFKLSVFVNMIDNLTQPAGGAGRAVDSITDKLSVLDNGFRNMTKSGFAIAGIGMEIAKAALAPVEATFDTKKALGELASLGIQDLEALEKASLDFSNTWAGTTKADFLTASYDIKSGIASLSDTAVGKYTEIAGITAKATKSTIAEMTDLFATGYGIYKNYYSDLTDIEFGEIFSAGIAKSVQQFKSSGSKMAASIQTLGASATVANVPLEEQFSILGMLQATMSGSESGTKYKAFLQSAAKAGEALKLSFTDANKQLLSLPEILSELRGKFGETLDAAEKMELQKAFGTAEAVAMIDLLYGKTGELESNILMLYDTMGNGIDVATNMANAINQTEGEKFTILKQRIDNTIETIGNGMLPVINQWLEKGAVLLEYINGWIEDNQALVSKIFIVIAVIGVLITVFGVLKVAFGFIGTTVIGSIKNFKSFVGVIKGIPGALETLQLKAMYAGDAIKSGFSAIKSAGSTVITSIGNVTKSIFNMAKAAVINGATAVKNMVVSLVGMAKQATTTAVTAMPGLIASVWSFTAALLANPITWVVVGIVALIAAIILLWRNWDTVVVWLQNVWNNAVQGVLNTLNWIKEKISSVPESVLALIAVFMPLIGIPLIIIKHWDVIQDFFINLWGNIKEGFNSFISGWIPNMLESGKKVISTFCDGIKSMISKPVEIVQEGLAKVRNLLPFSDAKEGPLSQLTLSGSRVFTTIGEGMERTMNIPSSITENSFEQINTNYISDFKNPGLSAVTNIPDDITENIINQINMEYIPEDINENIFNQINMEHIPDFENTDSNYVFDKSVIDNHYKSEPQNTITTEKTEINNEANQSDRIANLSIGNVNLHFDIKDLEDLKLVKRLVLELQHLCNQEFDEPVSLL